MLFFYPIDLFSTEVYGKDKSNGGVCHDVVEIHKEQALYQEFHVYTDVAHAVLRAGYAEGQPFF